MAILGSAIDTSSAEYTGDRAAMVAALAELDALGATVVGAGGEKTVARHRSRGKLLARERVDLLVDEDAPFLELSAFAGAHEEGEQPGARLITGVGQVSGVECVIVANEATVKGGSISPSAVAKQLRALEIADRNRLPVVSLVESGGADLPRQTDIFIPGGRSFRDLTRLSAQGVPTIALVFGSSTAGGAYVPGMSEYTVLVDRAAAVYLGGPPLVKMATGEEVDDETLGGAEMHARVSGLADYLAPDERSAIRIGRQIVADLDWKRAGPPPSALPEPPLLDPDELLGVAPAESKRPMDVREVLGRVLDGSRFDEFKPLYGSQLVCGWGSIAGYRVGILANNGILFSPESQKGAHFIQLANARDIPLLFVQNITGFMVGTAAEHGGIIKDGAKLINAVSNSTVPHLTLMVGASYGAGNYGMSGRAYDPRFIFTWPNHRIAVMGGAQLAGVMSIIQRRSAERAGRPYDDATDRFVREQTEAMIESQSGALYATGRLWDDGVIDPRHTRTVLGLALSAVHSAPVAGATRFAPFRM
ncbi:acyl-CoA carboxylase subunit beta [Actinocorallia sp. API 0066]|uniref:acyl-CoA carboxylase subunit beta n=1 Tax=Actinocorallia sp. API 0066 TaxID=2896846 RepID=UPI001E5DB138|nr:carboxyl transferase domain-containing protein [Actinocorallia sp. API 0066]MCD0449236.1 acyl-CoA carboxylase subunit beta [Actinocorallia sp. API 0066]